MGYANKHHIAILLLQDYYHQNEEIWAVPSKNWQTFTSINHTAAIVITRQDLQAIQTYTDENSVFINLTTQDSELTIGSLYSKPSSDLSKDMHWLEHFIPLKRLILGADLNVHLSLLGYQNEDARGTLFTYLLISHNLTLLNDTEAPPTFIGEPNRPCRGNPDVTVCTREVVDLVDSWYVDESTETSSDHRYILFSLNLKPQIIDLKRYKTKFTNFKKLNKHFKNSTENLTKNLDNVHTTAELDIWLEDFNNKLTNSCNKTLRVKQLKLYLSFDWWNAALRSQ